MAPLVPLAAQAFCGMIAYNVTKDVHTPISDPHNIKELDEVAKDIYHLAVEVRRLPRKKLALAPRRPAVA